MLKWNLLSENVLADWTTFHQPDLNKSVLFLQAGSNYNEYVLLDYQY